MFKVPEQYRVVNGDHPSGPAAGNNGLFLVPCNTHKSKLKVVSSDGEGWEHVSVSLPNRTPTWEEMCKIKDLFWGEDDCVIQYHPPRSNYVNNHQYCLHMWRPTEHMLPAPSDILVGYTGNELETHADDVIYTVLGVLTRSEDEERRRVARAMMKYGGNFVSALGDLLQRTDRENTLKIKRTWANYYNEYKEISKKEGDEDVLE